MTSEQWKELIAERELVIANEQNRASLRRIESLRFYAEKAEAALADCRAELARIKEGHMKEADELIALVMEKSTFTSTLRAAFIAGAKYEWTWGDDGMTDAEAEAARRYPDGVKGGDANCVLNVEASMLMGKSVRFTSRARSSRAGGQKDG
jgi:hypothetical protein